MFAKYIIRLDDASPTMNRKNWERMEQLLDKYKIKPMVAIIPNNGDEKLMLDDVDTKFWDRARGWQEKKWEIALHGYAHTYVTQAESIVPINNYSEFAGLDLEIQREKIRAGIKIFKEERLRCRLWIAPAHSFDLNTIYALQSETEIRVISDGIAFNPYWEHEMFWVPQQLWKARKMPFGTWTICFHPDTMREKAFQQLELFLEGHHREVISMDELMLKKREKNALEKIFEKVYWRMLAQKRRRKIQK